MMFSIGQSQFEHEIDALNYASSLVNSKSFSCYVMVMADSCPYCEIGKFSFPGADKAPIELDGNGGYGKSSHASQEAYDSEIENAKNANYAKLWQAAHDYEYKYISGTAPALVAMGVQQSKPKCLAVMNWCNSVWTLYYQRKALTNHDMPLSYLDFSQCGAMPYSIPEVMQEMGLS